MQSLSLGSCLVQPRFGQHGASRIRLDRLQAQAFCRCHRQTCYQRLDGLKEALLQFLRIFWSMAKHVQDEYIRQTAGAREEPYRDWYLLGKRFGRQCCLAVLGLGNCRFQRVRQGRPDRRFSVWGGSVLCHKFGQLSAHEVLLFLVCFDQVD